MPGSSTMYLKYSITYDSTIRIIGLNLVHKMIPAGFKPDPSSLLEDVRSSALEGTSRLEIKCAGVHPGLAAASQRGF